MTKLNTWKHGVKCNVDDKTKNMVLSVEKKNLTKSERVAKVRVWGRLDYASSVNVW